VEQQQQHLALMARAAATAPAVIPVLANGGANGYQWLPALSNVVPLRPVPTDVPGSPSPLSPEHTLLVLGVGPVTDLIVQHNVQVFSFAGDPMAPASFALLRERQLFLRPDVVGGSTFTTAVNRLYTAGLHNLRTMLCLGAPLVVDLSTAAPSSSPCCADGRRLGSPLRHRVSGATE
jgi:hypothetical protein